MTAIWTPALEPPPSLGGGTALAAFYADHRRSDDLDLFVSHPAEVSRLGDMLGELLAAQVPDGQLALVGAHPLQRRYEVSLAHAGTVIDIAVLETVPEATSVMDGVRVLGVTDIAGGKMAAASRRVEMKDAVDLWALREVLGLSQEDLVGAARRVEPGFIIDPALFAKTLATLRGAVDELPMPAESVVERASLRTWLAAELKRALKSLDTRPGQPGQRELSE